MLDLLLQIVDFLEKIIEFYFFSLAVLVAFDVGDWRVLGQLTETDVRRFVILRPLYL